MIPPHLTKLEGQKWDFFAIMKMTLGRVSTEEQAFGLVLLFERTQNALLPDFLPAGSRVSFFPLILGIFALWAKEGHFSPVERGKGGGNQREPLR